MRTLFLAKLSFKSEGEARLPQTIVEKVCDHQNNPARNAQVVLQGEMKGH